MAEQAVTGRHRRGGPPLGLVMGVSLGLFLASLVVPAVLTGGTPYPSPLRPAAAVADYVRQHGTALRLSGFFQFAASVPLAVFAASATAQLRRVGVQVAGPLIGLVGGVLASVALAVSALLQWTLAQTGGHGPAALLVALRDAAFVTGGSWHTVGLGLLVAGVAVPALVYRLLPRWLAVAGVVIAVVCELTTLVLVWDPAAYLIPLGRFPALLWLLVAGLRLPVTRHREVRS